MMMMMMINLWGRYYIPDPSVLVYRKGSYSHKHRSHCGQIQATLYLLSHLFDKISSSGDGPNPSEGGNLNKLGWLE